MRAVVGAIALECAAIVFDVLVDALAGVLASKVIDFVSRVGGGMLADVKVNALLATTTALAFAM